MFFVDCGTIGWLVSPFDCSVQRAVVVVDPIRLTSWFLRAECQLLMSLKARFLDTLLTRVKMDSRTFTYSQTSLTPSPSSLLADKHACTWLH